MYKTRRAHCEEAMSSLRGYCSWGVGTNIVTHSFIVSLIGQSQNNQNEGPVVASFIDFNRRGMQETTISSSLEDMRARVIEMIETGEFFEDRDRRSMTEQDKEEELPIISSTRHLLQGDELMIRFVNCLFEVSATTI
jgi:hypothetical protein